jgi:O-antigen/teichoic acid export membrane protein
MFIGILFDFVVEPIFLVAYAINRPQLLALSMIIKLVISISANLLLIPTYSAMGAAVAAVITYILGGIITLFLVINHLNKAFVRDEV